MFVILGHGVPNEPDTCRRYVVPKLQAAGWDEEPRRISEQVTRSFSPHLAIRNIPSRFLQRMVRRRFRLAKYAQWSRPRIPGQSLAVQGFFDT